MNSNFADLAAALRERLAIISDAESLRDVPRHLERLKAVTERIATTSAALPRPLNPQLAHYLQRSSYDKALEYLMAS